MSFNTNKINPPTLSTLIPPSLFGGQKKLGVSIWLRFSKRLAQYTYIFGNTEDYGNHTFLFDLKYHSTNRFNWRVALTGLDGKRIYTNILSSTYQSDNTWVHLWLTYDSTLPISQFQIYINGNLSGTATTLPLLLWTNPTHVNITLKGNSNASDTTDIGEIVLYTGDTLPDLQSIIDYTNLKPLPNGAILNYKNVSLTDTNIIPQEIIPEVNGYNLKCISGQGLLTPETSSKTASIKLIRTTIKTLGSGESIWTEWTTLNGTNPGILSKDPVLNPIYSIKRDGSETYSEDVVITNRIVKDNLIIWVIPKEVRPTSIKDKLEIYFPVGLLINSNLQFSEDITISPTNNFGKIHYTLPKQPRCKVGTCGGGIANYYTPQYSFNNQALTAGPWYSDITLDNRGIPIATSVPKSRALSYIYAWVPTAPKGEVHILWQGTETSNLGFSQGKLLSPNKEIINYNNQQWYRLKYDVQVANPLLTTWSDANCQTGITDIIVVKPEHWDDLVAGKKYTKQCLDVYKSMDYIRWMDVVNSNTWDVTHICDKNYSICTQSSELASNILSIEPTIDPNQYFGGLVVKITTDKPHGLKSGQRVT
jgi:hypothetical protein